MAMFPLRKKQKISLLAIVVAAILLAGAYWRSNTPPKRPQGVSTNAVFWWAGHVGLPAPRHGMWLECWAETASVLSRCRVTEMDGRVEYEGAFLPNKGQPATSQSSLKILIETTRDANLWIRMSEGNSAPLIFLQNGTVLIPKRGYAEGLAKLDGWEEAQPK